MGFMGELKDIPFLKNPFDCQDELDYGLSWNL
jgi:hypothetical protein